MPVAPCPISTRSHLVHASSLVAYAEHPVPEIHSEFDQTCPPSSLRGYSAIHRHFYTFSSFFSAFFVMLIVCARGWIFAASNPSIMPAHMDLLLQCISAETFVARTSPSSFAHGWLHFGSFALAKLRTRRGRKDSALLCIQGSRATHVRQRRQSKRKTEKLLLRDCDANRRIS